MSLPRDPDHDLDRLLADDGGDLAALYRRLPKAEPPRRLDRSVIGAAARAVHGHTPRRQRWLVGVGSAAGVVLAAGIAWHVGQDAVRRESQGDMSAQGVPTTPSHNRNYVPVQPLGEPTPRHTAAPPAAQDAAVVAPATAPAPPPPAAAKPAPRKAEAHEKERARAPIAQPSAPPPAAAPPAAAPMPAREAFPAEQQRQEAEAAGASQAGGADAAGVISNERTDAKSLRMRAAPAPPSSSVELRRDMQLAPDDWLAHVRQLLRQGRRQQAIESLRLFHSAHPRYPLPRELSALLD
ncbi:MAG TPA: hypothetical protein VFS55_14830 [Dokdonella sp.]|nr:hypothetical protein [Dokdonella sp.]